MEQNKDVISVMPIEETLIDPLYEPLKLNRYKLCLHLQRLKNDSHVRHGVSPYLLFDVEEMKRFMVLLNREGSDEKFKEFDIFYDEFQTKLREYLKENKKGIENAEALNELYGKLYDKREMVLTAYKGAKDKYRKILNKVLYEEGSFNNKSSFNKVKFEKISHLFQLAHPVTVSCPTSKGKKQFMCAEGKIYSMKEELLRTFELRRAKWLHMSGSLHTVHRSATHTRLSHQIGSMIVGMNALREIDVYPYDDVAMSLGDYLLMRGDLHEFLMANFLHDIGHSPLSHVLEPNPFIDLDHEKITANLILGERMEKSEGIDWYVTEHYLLKMKAIKDFKYRFFQNDDDLIYVIPYNNGADNEFLNNIDYNENILESEIVTVKEVLDNFAVEKKRVVEILTEKVYCPECKIFHKIKDLESDLTCPQCGKKINEEEIKAKSLEAYVTCSGCQAKSKIKELKERMKCTGNHEQDIREIQDIQFLNKLIHSEIDLDRMDHVRRDSMICGLSLTSFRLIELLGSISVVLPDSRIYNDVYTNGSDERDADINSPYIFVSKSGLSYVMDLLNSRRAIYNNVMFSDENNWINGVVNQITALAVRYLPHLTNMLPFITDPILGHFFTNDIFLGTPIEKLNMLLHGKNDSSSYGKPMRYKLKDGEVVTSKNLKKIYTEIEDINNMDAYKKLRLPAVVFYTNIQPIRCPKCDGELKDNDDDSYKYKCKKCREPIKEAAVREYLREKDEKKRSWEDMLVFGKKFVTTDGHKYLKFKELLKRGEKRKNNDTSMEMFPAKPNELDVKNLFYVWINDFVIKADTDDKNKSEEECKNYIKKRIAGIWASNGTKIEFKAMFVDLDDAKEDS